jgi:hypothetical protein
VFRITKDDGKIEQIKKPTNSLVRKTAVDYNGDMYCIDTYIFHLYSMYVQNMNGLAFTYKNKLVRCCYPVCLKSVLQVNGSTWI